MSNPKEDTDGYRLNSLEPAFLTTDCNPIVSAARELINWGVYLNTKSECLSVNAVFDELNERLDIFVKTLDKQQIGQDASTLAHYLICTFIDEMVLSSAWGINSSWAQRGLLQKHHQSINGGNMFFDILEEQKADPGKNRNCLELIYLMLACGYQGKYLRRNDAELALPKIRQQLFHLLNTEGTNQRLLAPKLHAIARQQGNWPKAPKARWALAACLVVGIVGYFSFAELIRHQATPLVQRLEEPLSGAKTIIPTMPAKEQ